jgi:hypothetical protein
MEPLGGEQGVIAGLRTRSGEGRGALALYRELGQQQFNAEELDLGAAPPTDDGARLRSFPRAIKFCKLETNQPQRAEVADRR